MHKFTDNVKNQPMSEKEKRRADYFVSLTVGELSDVEVLSSEKVWEILDYVHGSPQGVRPKEVAKEFDLKINQAYDKLKKLERQDYLVRKKERGKRGQEQERKTLLYLSKPWGGRELNEEFEEILYKRYGEFVMKSIRPMFVELFKQVLDDMQKDPELKPWFPAAYENLCPDCGTKHQALELFRALIGFAADVTEGDSYEWHQVMLDRGYLSKKEFIEYVKRSVDDPKWRLSDKPTP
jgi:DNA-binding MarR family transcriptional regulator